MNYKIEIPRMNRIGCTLTPFVWLLIDKAMLPPISTTSGYIMYWLTGGLMSLTILLDGIRIKKHE